MSVYVGGDKWAVCVCGGGGGGECMGCVQEDLPNEFSAVVCCNPKPPPHTLTLTMALNLCIALTV